eukprot:scaffold17603_cov54-Phaeocystis_antarctica.AAC.1
MKLLYVCTLARSDPPPVDRRQRFLLSFLCPHTTTLGVSTRDPLALASEAYAANSEGEDALAGE